MNFMDDLNRMDEVKWKRLRSEAYHETSLIWEGKRERKRGKKKEGKEKKGRKRTKK